jgi:hypothetical protein
VIIHSERNEVVSQLGRAFLGGRRQNHFVELSTSVRMVLTVAPASVFELETILIEIIGG